MPLEGLRFFELFNYQVLVFCNTASVFHNANTLVYKFKNATKLKKRKDCDGFTLSRKKSSFAYIHTQFYSIDRLKIQMPQERAPLHKYQLYL